MENKDLLKRLSSFGFAVFEPEEAQDANATLADVVKSQDTRLWEGFPVVLANSAEKGLLDYNVLKRHLGNVSGKQMLGSLMAMSMALYKALNLDFPWAVELYQCLLDNKKKEYAGFMKKLKENKDLEVAGHLMSSQRLKSVFNNYFARAQSKVNDLLAVKEGFGFEYAMSEVFSPKQKELFFKKLKREKLTKTEREYFSRVVRKKILALANPELHRLSQKLLG
jgi:hypothetical protein